ncbi:hypothetical protein AWM79_12935 [Pseudomonas agarici]|uniref:Carrier domain-containing protein n=2 Tax=Pseudomonas agarici TaxID=46677 RepID=A0A0X1T276_PSEAA|nr:non-ribosomal peptide synthetase [Pseudomonas agarici]AMB86153.1 hypothetical protein AWM79_12935 [Pseudomonas agarici]
MAELDNLALVQRFIRLPLAQRQVFLERLAGKGMSLSHLPIPAMAHEFEPIPLSYAQQRQWFLWQLDPDSAAYHIPSALRLRGSLDLAALEQAFNDLIVRHASLRTRFEQAGEQAVQVIEPEVRLRLNVQVLEPQPDEARCHQRIEAFIQARSSQLFDLRLAPLLRADVLQIAAGDHVLVMTLHHIIADGVSMRVLVDELIQGYLARIQSHAPQWPVLPIQYADYAIWQRQWMEAGERARQLAYWQDQLGDEHPLLQLPTDFARPAEQSHRGARLELELPLAKAQALKRLARSEGVTPFMVLLASFQFLLYRYSGQADIRVGVPIANRQRLETEGLIGFFINTQVLAAKIEGHLRFVDLLQQVKQTALGAQAHQDLPFEQLVEALQPQRSLSHGPLFQVMLNHQSDTGQAQLPAGLALQIEHLACDDASSKFDLTLETVEHAEGLSANFIYATDLFRAATIERLAADWQGLLDTLIAEPTLHLGEVVTGARDKPVTDFAVAFDGAPTAGVQTLFERQAARNPEAIAVVCGDRKINYGELERWANRLAARLLAQGVGPEVGVGIAAARSIELIVAMLAVLKAGGCYLALDVTTPIERQQQLLADSGIGLLLSDAQLCQRPALSGPFSLLELDACEPWAADQQQAPEVASAGQNIAYLIYTSGSTGRPKGVMVSHAALLNYVQALLQRVSLEDVRSLAMVSTVAADLGYTQLFAALCSGRTLHLIDTDLAMDAEGFAAYMSAHAVDALKIVPSHLSALLKARNPSQVLPRRCLILGGEACPAQLLDSVHTLMPHCRVFNHYGPSETTIGVLATALDLDRSPIRAPLGHPLANIRVHLLDADLQPVIEGVPGELQIAGAGLARGYLRQPGLTAQRFVPDPSGEGGRLYRSGDRGRLTDEGIEYLGRIDDQVKIRGYRVEPGEVAAALRRLPALVEAAVLAVPGRVGKQLVAYAVPGDGTLLSADPQVQARHCNELLLQLRAYLPDYMIPAHLVLVPGLPLNANGKLDRKALPAVPSGQGPIFIAPHSALEQRIAAIWQDVLKLEQVGLTDNFFELGGDSIISIQVVSRARQAGIRFTPKQLFQHQTVQGLATIAQEGADLPAIDQGAVSGELPLLPIQQAFFERVIAERHHWNQSVLLQSSRVLDPVLLEQALQALIIHHDALRQSFSEQPQGWRARYRSVAEQRCCWDDAPVLAQVHGVAPSMIETLGLQVQRSLELGDGPLVKALLMALEDGSQRLLLVIHHLVVDGVSWRILFEDLQRAYQQLANGQPVALPAKTTSVKAWAKRLQDYAQGPAKEQLAFWQARLQHAPADLPGMRLASEPCNDQSITVYTRLAAGLTRQLLQQAPAAYRTQVNDLLLTALARVIARWTGESAVLIQLEGHGREELFDEVDLTRTVGWFSSKYPVRLDPGGDFPEAIKTIKEQLRAAPAKGIGFGLLRYLGDAPTRAALAALAEPRITFNYLGQFDGSFAEDERALFSPASESAGAEQSGLAPLGNWLTLNGQVFAGELSLGWTFSAQRFAPELIQRLADDYAAELAALVAHCCLASSHGVTPADFPLARLTQEQLDSLALEAASVEDLFPLAPMQQGMLFHSLYEQAAGDYINQLRVDVAGLDPERFIAAWQSVVDRHEVLRSGFLWEGRLDQPLQVVHKHCSVPFSVLDWRSDGARMAGLDRLANEELKRGFNLSEAPLLRVYLVQTEDTHHHLIYTHHHILMDGWSSSRLLGEVLQAYAGQPLGRAAVRYRDYIAWLQAQDQQASKDYWLEHLRGLEAPTRLAHALATPAGDTDGYADHHQVFDSRWTQALGDFARQQKVTVNTVLQAAWLLLLQRYTGQRAVSFGATVAGRPAELRGVEEQIGLFINTLPVIASPCAEQTVADWLQDVQAQNIALREQEHTPLFEIQRWAGYGGEALFDSILVFENYPVSEALQQGAPEALQFGPVNSHEQSNYPLTLTVSLSDTLALHYRYVRAQFAEASIRAISQHLDTLLSLMQQDVRRPLGELGLLSADERRLQLEAWNANELAYPRELCIHQQIDAQASSQPQAIALTVGAQHWSYEQLNRRANQLAHRLIESGVGPEVRVGVAMSRSAQMVVALLAVLKAGGTYVPLDPDYPAERVAYMLEDSGAKVLLTERELLAGLTVPQAEILVLEATGTAFAEYPAQTPDSAVTAQNLAYVIYTSGSTGQPKGVAITHRNVAALIQWSRQVYSQDDLQGVLASTSICFDLSVWELFVTLARGGSIILARNALELPDLPARDQVRLINTVPSAIAALQRAGQIPASVRIINLAGEPLKQALVDSLYGLASVEHVYDLYGPSEDTTYSTWTRREAGGLANIGRPLANTQSYLLDSQLQPVPPGVAAELYLAGAGITRGYLFRPGLTAEKFVPNPFGESGERLYRTGDLCRYRRDGVLEYVGRLDHQVKVRGFRIELGEIEARLLAQGQLQEVAVLAVEGGAGSQLVAYAVPLAGRVDGESAQVLRETLKGALRASLPDYMVPAHWLFLEALPLTPNGKLDRKALPGVDETFVRRAWRAPQGELEGEVALIWQDVLQVERVGLDDNFFDLGGHSLLATQVIVRLRNQLRAEVPLKSLFETHDLQAFCRCVETHRTVHQSLDEELAKSLEALKRLSSNELEKLIS